MDSFPNAVADDAFADDAFADDRVAGAHVAGAHNAVPNGCAGRYAAADGGRRRRSERRPGRW